MIRHGQSWKTRSLLSRFAHVVERTGLALTGGSSGLFVAALVARSDLNLINSSSAIVAIMVYGASGFYLGIDLPPGLKKSRQAPPRRLGHKADKVELLSAAGTLLTAVAAVIAVSDIILDEIPQAGSATAILLGWATGASMQIAAGILARLRADSGLVSSER